MNRLLRFLTFLLLICLILPSCNNHGGPAGTDFVTVKPEDDLPKPEEYHYGRLSVGDFFLMKTGNGMRFTLQFEKKVFNAGDDIAVTVYVSNYVGEDVTFETEEPIVSRQQLLHAGFSYGGGLYEVPFTLEYTEETDCEGGVESVVVPNRSLIAGHLVIHTSDFTNVEESAFGESFADTYDLRFWVGEDAYNYYIDVPVTYQHISREETGHLQNICTPPSYVKVVGDVRFTVSFDHLEYSMDDDIVMHVKVENIGKEPLNLYFNSLVSDPIYFVRASLKYGTDMVVRDTVKSTSEIPGLMESEGQLKRGEVIERDITFYTSEFSATDCSIFDLSAEGSRVLTVNLCLRDEVCEIEIPLTSGSFKGYSYVKNSD